jgi:hydroxymethylglutaryl-CoA lyase
MATAQDALPRTVRIVEVGPRDGLQNEPQQVATEVKLELIARLVAAGATTVEAGSFVSPKWVPQMADSGDVLRRLPRPPGVRYTALVPNLKGFEAAVEAGCEEVAIFGAASETFSRKNINCGIRESLERFLPVLAAANAQGVRVRGYVSCVVGCPYEGPVAPQAAAEVARWLHDHGCYEVSLGDTIGSGTPASVQAMIEACARVVPIAALAGHYHDTWGMAAANVYASLELGVGVFDASVAGLGGCPYSPGASGNVATEDVVHLLQGLGLDCAIRLDPLVDAAVWISGQLGRPPASKVTQATIARRGRAARAARA